MLLRCHVAVGTSIVSVSALVASHCYVLGFAIFGHAWTTANYIQDELPGDAAGGDTAAADDDSPPEASAADGAPAEDAGAASAGEAAEAGEAGADEGDTETAGAESADVDEAPAAAGSDVAAGGGGEEAGEESGSRGAAAEGPDVAELPQLEDTPPDQATSIVADTYEPAAEDSMKEAAPAALSPTFVQKPTLLDELLDANDAVSEAELEQRMLMMHKQMPKYAAVPASACVCVAVGSVVVSPVQPIFSARPVMCSLYAETNRCLVWVLRYQVIVEACLSCLSRLCRLDWSGAPLMDTINPELKGILPDWGAMSKRVKGRRRPDKAVALDSIMGYTHDDRFDEDDEEVDGGDGDDDKDAVVERDQIKRMAAKMEARAAKARAEAAE